MDTAFNYANAANLSRAGTTPGKPYIGDDGRMYGQSQAQEMNLPSGGPGGGGAPRAAPVQPVIGGPRIVKGSFNNDVAPDLPPAEPGMVGSFRSATEGSCHDHAHALAIHALDNSVIVVPSSGDHSHRMIG